MKTQSSAVIEMVINLAKERGYEATPFETDYSTVITKADEQLIGDMVFAGINDQEIGLSVKSQAKFEDDPKALRRYVTGLVNDRLRKAKALNGDTIYKYKNPGKLTNSRDELLKTLTQVLAITEGDEDKAAIQSEIDKRRKEIAALKVKTTPIDMSHLPADLVLFLNREK